MATAEVSDPPRPRVVISPWSSAPWNPATTTIFPSSSAPRRFWLSISRILALPDIWLVWMPAWKPKKDLALSPLDLSIMAIKAAVVCSPVASSTSSSLSSGFSDACLARLIRLFVTPAIAESTTTIRSPFSWAFCTRSATVEILSRSATDVPPNFCTRKAIVSPKILAFINIFITGIDCLADLFRLVQMEKRLFFY